jgi:hypothetical protein
MSSKVTRKEIEAAIARVQAGTSTPDDGNLLRAWATSVWRMLETAWAGEDEPIIELDSVGGD